MLNFPTDDLRKWKYKNKKKKNVETNFYKNFVYFSLILMAVAPILVSRTPSLDRDPVLRSDFATNANVQQYVENIISSSKCPAPYIFDADGRARDISGSFLFFWLSPADIDMLDHSDSSTYDSARAYGDGSPPDEDYEPYVFADMTSAADRPKLPYRVTSLTSLLASAGPVLTPFTNVGPGAMSEFKEFKETVMSTLQAFDEVDRVWQLSDTIKRTADGLSWSVAYPAMPASNLAATHDDVVAHTQSTDVDYLLFMFLLRFIAGPARSTVFAHGSDGTSREWSHGRGRKAWKLLLDAVHGTSLGDVQRIKAQIADWHKNINAATKPADMISDYMTLQKHLAGAQNFPFPDHIHVGEIISAFSLNHGIAERYRFLLHNLQNETSATSTIQTLTEKFEKEWSNNDLNLGSGRANAGVAHLAQAVDAGSDAPQTLAQISAAVSSLAGSVMQLMNAKAPKEKNDTRCAHCGSRHATKDCYSQKSEAELKKLGRSCPICGVAGRVFANCKDCKNLTKQQATEKKNARVPPKNGGRAQFAAGNGAHGELPDMFDFYDAT